MLIYVVGIVLINKLTGKELERIRLEESQRENVEKERIRVIASIYICKQHGHVVLRKTMWQSID